MVGPSWRVHARSTSALSVSDSSFPLVAANATWRAQCGVNPNAPWRWWALVQEYLG